MLTDAFIYHYVVEVPISDAQNIRDNAAAGTALDKGVKGPEDRETMPYQGQGQGQGQGQRVGKDELRVGWGAQLDNTSCTERNKASIRTDISCQRYNRNGE